MGFRIYPILFLARMVFLAIAFIGMVVTTVSLTIRAAGILMTLIIFLALLFRYSRILENVLKKEGSINVEYLMVIITFVMLVMLVTLFAISYTASVIALQFTLTSLIAGFVAGIAGAELIFLRRQRT